MDNYVDSCMDFIESIDPEVGVAVRQECTRQKNHIELIASENIVSSAVLAAMGTVLTNKYAEGYPGNRYYGGCEYVDVVEQIAIDRVKKIYGAEHANVQPHSGAQANFAAYHAFVKPGDTVLGMNLAHGGHLTHGNPANFSGRLFNVIPYNVDKETQRIDYDEIYRLAKEHKPKMIIAGASAYPREMDFARFSEIAKDVGAYLMVDMAHIGGLIAAGVHQSPIPYADVVTSTTHKTLRGPRGGLILCKAEHAKKIDKAVFPGTQGGPLMHIIAAKAVCFGEALKPEFIEYQKQIVINSKKLADGLIGYGFNLVTGGTDNHLSLIDLRNFSITGLDMQMKLDEVFITANKNAIPYDPEKTSVTSGLRIGTPAVTSRGFKEAEMERIAEFIYLVATDFAGKKDFVKKSVEDLCMQHPIY